MSNNESSTQGIRKEIFPVPLDVLMDILKVLITNQIRFRIHSLREMESIVCIEAEFNPALKNHPEAEENIRFIVAQYDAYRHAAPNSDWNRIS